MREKVFKSLKPLFFYHQLHEECKSVALPLTDSEVTPEASAATSGSVSPHRPDSLSRTQITSEPQLQGPLRPKPHRTPQKCDREDLQTRGPQRSISIHFPLVRLQPLDRRSATRSHIPANFVKRYWRRNKSRRKRGNRN